MKYFELNWNTFLKSNLDAMINISENWKKWGVSVDPDSLVTTDKNDDSFCIIFIIKMKLLFWKHAISGKITEYSFCLKDPVFYI